MSHRSVSFWLAFPAITYLTVFCALPTAIVGTYSFLERDFHGQVVHELSLGAWKQATDGITLRLVRGSVLLALAVTLLDLVLAYPSVLVLSRIGERRRTTWVLLISFPLVTSLLLRIYGWLNLLPLEWKGTFAAVGFVMAVNYLPFMILPLLRSLERMEPNVVEAAMDLGATPWQAFWRVTWPMTRPGMWGGCALVFIPVCGEYLVPHFIGEGKVTVIGTVIVQEFMERRNWPYAAACAMWVAAIVLLPAALSALGKSRDRAQG